MGEEITALQAAKDSKMTTVLALLFSHPDLGVKTACDTVGVDYDSFRYWQRTHPEFVSEIRTLLGEYQKEQILDLQLSWSVGLQKLSDALMNADTPTPMRLILHKYLTDIRDNLLKTYHAEPGVEEEAQRFLSKGPKTENQQSRFASMEVTRTADGVRVDLFEERQVIDGEIVQKSSEQNTDSHQESPD